MRTALLGSYLFLTDPIRVIDSVNNRLLSADLLGSALKKVYTFFFFEATCIFSEGFIRGGEGRGGESCLA